MLNREDYRTAIPSLEKKITTSFVSASESLEKLRGDIEAQFSDLDDRLNDMEDEISNLISVQSPITYSGGVIGINIGDYIVEQGTENGWTYRKWASGKAEAWYELSYTGSLNNSNGGWYGSPSGGQSTPDFPSGLFTSDPMRQATAYHPSGSNNVVAIIYNGTGTTNFGNIVFVRGESNANNYTYVADLYAIQL